jgi:hypothetical protein
MRRLGLTLLLLLPFVVLWINCRLKNEGLPRHLILAFLALDLVLVAFYLAKPSTRSKILLCLYSIFITFLFCEIFYSYYSSVVHARTFYVFEEPVNLEFDAVMGSRYTGRPARMACVVDDQIQWSMTVKGNNYGFPDVHDFSPHRANGERRVLVLGDSFTGARHCKELWPECVERLAAGDGIALELLNLAQGGYGVPNWTALLEGLVIREEWDVDEVLIAVYQGDDLERKFQVGGQSGGHPFVGKLDRWVIPGPDEDARELVARDREHHGPGENALVLSAAEYDRFLRSGRPNRYPRKAQRLRFDRLYLFDLVQRLSERLSERLKARFLPASRSSRPGGPGLVLTPEMRPIYERFKAALRRIGKPVRVIYIPYRPEILADAGYPGYNEVKEFADFVGGSFYDGADAFRPLSRSEREACFFPLDAHWNQEGAHRFGDYVYRHVLSPGEKTSHRRELPDRRAIAAGGQAD